MTKFVLFSLMLLGACSDGSEDGPVSGRWKGTAAGVQMTVEVHMSTEHAGSTVVQGVLTTSSARCLTSAMMAGSVTGSTVQFLASGPGSVSRSTTVDITGQLADGKITGQFTMAGDLDAPECEIEKAVIVLER